MVWGALRSPSACLVQLLAAGNHTVVRTPHGMQEGVADEQRKKEPKEVPKATAKAKQGNLG